MKTLLLLTLVYLQLWDRVCATSNTAVCTPCGDGKFQCADCSGCISNSWLCDGRFDCKDASDEAECTESDCFPPCTCFLRTSKMLCHNLGLTSVPEGLSEKVSDLGIKYLDLGNNLISNLTNVFFVGNMALFLRSFNEGNIQRPEKVIEELSSLKEHFPKEVFGGLDSLKKRDLWNSQPDSFPGNDFGGPGLNQGLNLGNSQPDSFPGKDLADLGGLLLENVIGGLDSSQGGEDLGENSISNPQAEFFRGFGSKLQQLFLNNNNIIQLPEKVFAGLTSLITLRLDENNIIHLPDQVFAGLTALTELWLSGNNIIQLPEKVFAGLTSLRILRIQSNDNLTTDGNPFEGLSSLQELRSDRAAICCLADGVLDLPDCQPRVGVASCEDMIGSTKLRVSVWLVGAACLVLNILVVTRRAEEGTTQSYLIGNLAICDSLYGAYLLTIAAVDQYYRGEYAAHNEEWRQSGLCAFVGFISTFSAELSVATLTVITVDRFIVIALNSPTKRLRKKHVKTILLAIWVAVFIICLIPCFDNAYFDNFYGQSEVCLPIPIVAERNIELDDGSSGAVRPDGWEYSAFIFIGINLASFLVIFILYVWMFVAVKRTQAAARSGQLKTDLALARKMTLIVGTDALCWMPVICLGIYSLLGNPISPNVYSAVIIMVLPINSAINPILYTMWTPQFLPWLKTSLMNKVQRLRSLLRSDTVELEMGPVRRSD